MVFADLSTLRIQSLLQYQLVGGAPLISPLQQRPARLIQRALNRILGKMGKNLLERPQLPVRDWDCPKRLGLIVLTAQYTSNKETVQRLAQDVILVIDPSIND